MKLKKNLAILFFIVGILFIIIARHDFQTFDLYSNISTLPTAQFCGDSVPKQSGECFIFFATQATIWHQRAVTMIFGLTSIAAGLILFFDKKK